jgi:hypothetical protein
VCSSQEEDNADNEALGASPTLLMLTNLLQQRMLSKDCEADEELDKRAEEDCPLLTDSALLRNTAINSFSPGAAAPTEDMVSKRMQELKQRDRQQLETVKIQQLLEQYIAQREFEPNNTNEDGPRTGRFGTLWLLGDDEGEAEDDDDEDFKAEEEGEEEEESDNHGSQGSDSATPQEASEEDASG